MISPCLLGRGRQGTYELGFKGEGGLRPLALWCSCEGLLACVASHLVLRVATKLLKISRLAGTLDVTHEFPRVQWTRKCSYGGTMFGVSYPYVASELLRSRQWGSWKPQCHLNVRIFLQRASCFESAGHSEMVIWSQTSWSKVMPQRDSFHGDRTLLSARIAGLSTHIVYMESCRNTKSLPTRVALEANLNWKTWYAEGKHRAFGPGKHETSVSKIGHVSVATWSSLGTYCGDEKYDGLVAETNAFEPDDVRPILLEEFIRRFEEDERRRNEGWATEAKR
eukprot:6007755-Amphidinium_carterae.1